MDSGGQLAILAILFKLSCECSSYSPPKDSMPLHIKSLKYVLLNTTIVPLGGVQEKKKKKNYGYAQRFCYNYHRNIN